MPRRRGSETGEMLSQYERDVFDLIVHEALEYEVIAKRLGVTRRTVKFHVGNILKKFEVANREQLILHFWKQRLEEERRSWKKRGPKRATARVTKSARVRKAKN